MGSPVLHALSRRSGREASTGSWPRRLLVSSRRLVPPSCSSTGHRRRTSIASALSFIMTIAFTRSVPRTIVDCELTHLNREPIDFARAAEQHRLYEKELVAAGCVIQRLPDLSELPDSVFVEDTAVVFRELLFSPHLAPPRGRPEASPQPTRCDRPLPQN